MGVGLLIKGVLLVACSILVVVNIFIEPYNLTYLGMGTAIGYMGGVGIKSLVNYFQAKVKEKEEDEEVAEYS